MSSKSPKLPWGEAMKILASSLEHYLTLLQREEDLRNNGAATPVKKDPPYREHDIRRAWKRMLEG